MKRIPMPVLNEFGKAYFVSRGFPDSAAQCIAEAGATAQAFGIGTHGLAQWFYVRSGIGKTIDPHAKPEILREQGATALLTGPRAPGQLLMDLASGMAISKAREFGISMISVRKTHWVGALGPYLLPIVREGLFAQFWAQASACRDCAPFGGIEATFSTNPLALAVPTDGKPMIADFSTAALAMAKVRKLVKNGKKADHPVFMDRSGQLTDDPAVVSQGGSILFTGGREHGHKGYALSLWSEALTAMAGGDCNNPDLPQSQSFNLTVIDPEAFGGRKRYASEMKRFLARVKGVRRLPGIDMIRLPGERGLQCLEEARSAGVPLDDATLERLNGMAAESGLSAL